MPDPRSVLIAHADAAIGAILADQLAHDGEFAASVVGTARATEAALIDPDRQFDAAILDGALPDRAGPELCVALRGLGVDIPLLLLAADADTLAAATEASDTIPVPFRLGELLARLRRMVREYEPANDIVLMIGPFQFRPAARLLRDPVGERRVRLTEKEAAILAYLHAAAGVAVDRLVLLNEVWGYNDAVATHTLETHIYRLRQKMEDDPSQARLLLTEGGGYRLAPNAYDPDAPHSGVG